MAGLEQQLITAVQKGDIIEVRSILEAGVNINSFTSKRTPLGVAARHGNLLMLELLLNSGQFTQNAENWPKKKAPKKSDGKKSSRLSKKKKGGDGNPGYHELIHDDLSDESESDLNMNVSIDEVETPEGMEGLEWDSELNDETESDYEDELSNQYRWYAKILSNSCPLPPPTQLDYSCDVNLLDSVGRTAIHYASEYGHVNAIKFLLNAGSKADVSDVDSLSPLHLAANGGHLAAVQTLLASGCVVNAKTTDKLTPLHYAAVKGHKEVVQVLLDSSAHVDCLDEGERTPLMLAVSRNYPEVAEVLIRRGARVNMEDVKGYTAMCEAVWGKSVVMARLLLAAGAKIVPSHFLVHYAVIHRQPEMVAALLEGGALVNVRDSNGDTPLMSAALTGQPQMVKLLIQHGAGVNWTGGSTEKTALHCAAGRGPPECPEILRLLVAGGAELDRPAWGISPLTAALLVGRNKTAITLIALGSRLRSSQAPLILRTECIPLAKAFVFAGYDVKSNFPFIEPPSQCPPEKNPAYRWLSQAKYNPLSLAELSRIVVRSQAVGILPHWVSSLPIPNVITRYLMLEDVLEAAEVAGGRELSISSGWTDWAWSPGSEIGSYSDTEENLGE